ncbi:histidine kinase [Rhodopirellula sp. ICT_H3.1]|uniref:Histidine kinase n=1 Tax=Aporhodopirellula aestuarii TaxID=2950107 RepID=A0ABT0UB56_9BACT|nr:histidine kinase [Aporhodopirellula aestuarii]
MVVTVIYLAATTFHAESAGATSSLSKLSGQTLQQRLATIDNSLKSLATPSMRTGIGAVGFRSWPKRDRTKGEWIQINLAEPATIDQVVLVPTIWRDTANRYREDGFPEEFRIRVGNGVDDEGTVVATFSADESHSPRVAPVVIAIHPVVADWIRIEASVLSPRGWDGMYVLQLSEILIFSGIENVALRQEVSVSSSRESRPATPWHKDYLVDGFVPYLIDASEGTKSLAYLSMVGVGDRPEIVIDLERKQRINRIHLHSIDQSDTVPQSVPEDFGFPRELIIEGANLEDFSDAIRLTDYEILSDYHSGPIVMRRFPEAECRYVRLVATQPYYYSENDLSGTRIGFAEIEIFSNGVNVAKGKTPSVEYKTSGPARNISALTDGHNLFGKILPHKQWLGELARRHDLEYERPRIAGELNERYLRQKANLRLLSWLVGLLGFIIVCTVLFERTLRQRAVFQMREQIAADLHDELGANLHAIGLLGDLVQKASDSPDRLSSLVRQIRDLTQRSGAATRYCTNMLESTGLFEDLVNDMRRTSARLMADFEHELTFSGEEHLQDLRPRTRTGLFLFYKECLTNILKHSHATRVTTELHAIPGELRLTVTDNGRGLSDSQTATVPNSLRRRARLLRAKVSVVPAPGGGTEVTLILHPNRFTIFR